MDPLPHRHVENCNHQFTSQFMSSTVVECKIKLFFTEKSNQLIGKFVHVCAVTAANRFIKDDVLQYTNHEANSPGQHSSHWG